MISLKLLKQFHKKDKRKKNLYSLLQIMWIQIRLLPREVLEQSDLDSYCLLP